MILPPPDVSEEEIIDVPAASLSLPVLSVPPSPPAPFLRPPGGLSASLPQPSRAALSLPCLWAQFLPSDLPRGLPSQEASSQRSFPPVDGLLCRDAPGGPIPPGGATHHRASVPLARPPCGQLPEQPSSGRDPRRSLLSR